MADFIFLFLFLTFISTIQGCSQKGGLSPLSQKLNPPKWNDTLYKGLWSIIILSPSQPNWASCHPLILESLGTSQLLYSCSPRRVSRKLFTVHEMVSFM